MAIGGQVTHRRGAFATANARAMRVSSGNLLADGSITCIVQSLSELRERRPRVVRRRAATKRLPGRRAIQDGYVMAPDPSHRICRCSP